MTTGIQSRLFPGSLKAKSARAGFLFVLPAVGLMMLFLVAPVVLAFSLGFTNAKFASPKDPEFVGLDNFTEMLSLAQVSVAADPSDENVAFDNLRELTKPAVAPHIFQLGRKDGEGQCSACQQSA